MNVLLSIDSFCTTHSKIMGRERGLPQIGSSLPLPAEAIGHWTWRCELLGSQTSLSRRLPGIFAGPADDGIEEAWPSQVIRGEMLLGGVNAGPDGVCDGVQPEWRGQGAEQSGGL